MAVVRRKRDGARASAIFRVVVVLFVALVAFGGSVSFGAVRATSAQAQMNPPGLQLQQGRILDGYGNDFIMRGINHPHSWFRSEMGSLADIKATGANAVRIVVSTGARFARTGADELAQLVSECRRHRLVCILEVHDTTGYPGVAGSISLAEAVDYWTSMGEILHGHEAHVIVNIGNEPFDNERADDWTAATISAVTRMRAAGFEHNLMVDAPNWGQDSMNIMRANAASVLQADPNRNLTFDVHMYGVYNSDAKIRAYVESFVRAGLALVIGEFGATHTDGDPDEDSIMYWAELYGIGYLAWSWSGNTSPVTDLNVVHDFAPGDLTSWGERVIDGPGGIASSGVEASIFGEPRALPRPLLGSPPELPQPLPVDEAKTPAVLVHRAEAEEAIRNGLSVSLHGAGYSGAGYLTGFDARGDSVTLRVLVEHAGNYDLHFGYRAPYGEKTQRMLLNRAHHGSVTFGAADTFTTSEPLDVGLRAGENWVTIEHDWGWFDLDFVEVWSQAS